MIISAFDFAKTKETLTNILPHHQFYLIDGQTSVVIHGDTEDFSRVFLLAAPSEAHARVWVEMNYLITTPCESHQELIEAMNEQTIGEDEEDCVGSKFIGCIDAGGYKYRSIERILEITRESAIQIFELGSYYESNLTKIAFN